MRVLIFSLALSNGDQFVRDKLGDLMLFGLSNPLSEDLTS